MYISSPTVPELDFPTFLYDFSNGSHVILEVKLYYFRDGCQNPKALSLGRSVIKI